MFTAYGTNFHWNLNICERFLVSSYKWPNLKGSAISVIRDQHQNWKHQVMNVIVWIHFFEMSVIHTYTSTSSSRILQILSLDLLILYLANAMCNTIYYGNEKARVIVSFLNALISFEKQGTEKDERRNILKYYVSFK
jgi:hypothetical protein